MKGNKSLKCRLLFWILLMVALVHKTHAITIPEDDPFEGYETYIDSCFQVYKSQKGLKKIKAAMTLWSWANHNYHFADTFRKPFQKLDTSGLTDFINDAVAGSNDGVLSMEWELLMIRKRMFYDRSYYPSIDTVQLPTHFKAAFYVMAMRDHHILDLTGYKNIYGYRRCYHLIKDVEGYIGLKFISLQHLSHYYFNLNNIDSSAFFFEKLIDVLNYPLNCRYQYVPGYGLWHHPKILTGQIRMNLGMVLEKQGSTIRGMEEYKLAIIEFEKYHYKPGIWWGKSLLVNSYMDMQNYSRAQYHFDELIRGLEEHFDTLTFDIQYVWNAINEFNYYDLNALKFYLDTTLSKIEANSKQIRIKRYYPYHTNLFYQWMQRALMMRWSIKQLSGQNISRAKFLSQIDSLQINYEAGERLPENDEAILAVMKLNRLACRIALKEGDYDENVIEYLKRIKQDDLVLDWTAHVKTAMVFFHAMGEFATLERLIESYLPKVEKGGSIIDQRNLYFQYSEVLKKLGEYQKSLTYFIKSDSLRQLVQNINQHEQLSMLDKKLEVAKERGKAVLLEKENVVLIERRSRWAVLGVTALLVTILIVALYLTARKRYQAERAKQVAELKLLEQEKIQKEHALQNTTLELVKSNTNFSQLLHNIEQLSGEMNTETKKKTRSVLMEHRAQLQGETWRRFNLEFENANANFYQKLKEQIEGITESELRIAAMHVSGLSNKEISAITGQQISSLHTHKSRLRKKIGVDDDKEMLNLLKSYQMNQT